MPHAAGAALAAMAAPPAPAAPLGMFDLVATLVHANTRMAEMVIQGAPSMMHAASHLITAADGASLPMRRPVLLPPEAETDTEDEPLPETGLPPWLITLIQQTVQAMIPMVLDKLPGLPLAGLFDWSKAVPPVPVPPPAPSLAPHPAASPYTSATPAAVARAAPRPSLHGPSTGQSYVPSGSAARASGSSSPLRNPVPPVTARAITSLPIEVVGGAADANDASPSANPAASASAHEPPPLGDSRELRAHLLALWGELSASEREHAQTFLGALTAEERGQWMLELATLTVPDAVARVRDVLRPRAATPTIAQQGDSNETHP